MLNWLSMGEEEFNRIAEQLIRRSVMEDNPGVDVKALDGRGGDGGIDLDATVARTGQLIAIYQLKWFPEGFSGAWARARKPQIRKSFDVALQHDPPAWYLVVPRNLTAKERSFVRSLQEHRRRPMTRYIGATELDAMLVRFPAIEEWAQRNPLRSALELTGRSSAALCRPDDLHNEMRRLAARVSARSDYWGVDISMTGNVYTETLVALRPDAAEREPLTLTLNADFSEHRELGEAYKRTLEYGGTEPIVLPETVVKAFERHGPEWFAGPTEVGQLEFHPVAEVLDARTSVSLLGPDDRLLAQRTGVSAKLVRGLLGGQLIIDLGDNLTFTFVMSREEPGRGAVNISSEVAGLSGAAARRVLRFLSDVSRAERISFSVDGKSSAAVIDGHNLAPEPFVVELADDLAYIEEALNITLLYPEEIDTVHDRVWVRVVRRILEGKVSLVPGIDGMNAILSGDVEDGLIQLLESGGALWSQTRVWSIDLFGQTVQVDDVSTLMPHATVKDSEEHLVELRAGRGENRRIDIVPADGRAGVLIWSPSRIGDLEVLTPTPWGLTEIREHRQLRQPTT